MNINWNDTVWQGPVYDDILDPLCITFLQYRWKQRLIFEIWNRWNTMHDTDWKPSSIHYCKHWDIGYFPLSNKLVLPFKCHDRYCRH